MPKRERNLRRAGGLQSELAGASSFYVKHCPCLHGSIVTTRQSLASRFLAVGLLRSPRLRCSWSGQRKVTRLKHNLHLVRCRLTTANRGHIPALLRADRRISHLVRQLNFAGTSRHGAQRNGFLKSLSAAFCIRNGAEGQQGVVPNEIPLTPERRGNNRDVSTEQRRHAAAVPGTPGSYSRSDPREDARTPAGSDVAFPRSLFTTFAGVRLPSPQRLDLARVSLPAPASAGFSSIDGVLYAAALMRMRNELIPAPTPPAHSLSEAA